MSSDGLGMLSRRAGSAALWSTFTGDVMAIHGEVDVSTCDLFATIVEEAVERAEGGGAQHEIHVDLGGLHFIDVSGARVLVAAGAGRSLGSQLVIDRPPALLARILDVGWGPVTGLRLGPRELIGGAGSTVVGKRTRSRREDAAAGSRRASVVFAGTSPARVRRPGGSRFVQSRTTVKGGDLK